MSAPVFPHAKRSGYMEWAKTCSAAKFNLATSGLTSITTAEFPLRLENVEVNGPGGYGYPPLLERIARHTGAPVDCIVTAAGTSMANHLALAALLSPGDEVVIEEPAYGPLLDVAHYLGARVRRVARRFENDFDVSLGEMEAAITPSTRLVVLTNLHNPTGALLDAETLRAIGEMAGRVGAYVLVDEAYLDMLFDDDRRFAGRSAGVDVGLPDDVDTHASHREAATGASEERGRGQRGRGCFSLGENFVATTSLTKTYGLSSLRCGWILAAPELARRIWLLNDLFAATPAHVAERLSVVAFDHLAQFRRRAQDLLATNRLLLDEFLRGRSDLQCFRPAAGSVVFPRLTRGEPESFFHLLREKYETSVVPGHFFELSRHFRLGIGGETGNLRGGLERLGAALDEFSKLA